MSGELVAFTTIYAFALYLWLARRARARGLAGRGAPVRRVGGIAHYGTLLAPMPYLVVALRPGPELAFPDTVRWIGLALDVGGIAFAIWSLRTLGAHFDLDLAIHREHAVVRTGPYAIVRHPIYLGLIAHLAGACLATGNDLLIAGTIVGLVPFLLARARAEETLLREELGPAYGDYAASVPMLLPFPRTGTFR